MVYGIAFNTMFNQLNRAQGSWMIVNHSWYQLIIWAFMWPFVKGWLKVKSLDQACEFSHHVAPSKFQRKMTSYNIITNHHCRRSCAFWRCCFAQCFHLIFVIKLCDFKFQAVLFSTILGKMMPKDEGRPFQGGSMQPGIGGLDPDQITSKLRSDIRSHSGDSTNL